MVSSYEFRMLVSVSIDPDIITALNADARCAVISGRRNHQPVNCIGAPAAQGGAPRSELLFTVCSVHAHLVSDPRPITA